MYDSATGEEWTFLHADPSVRCSGSGHTSDEHEQVVSQALIFVLIWVVGAVLLFGGLIALAAPTILKGGTSPLTRATWVLWREYKSEYCFWEVVELCRRLFLTGAVIPVFEEKFAFTRLLVACFVTLLYATVLMLTTPYRRDSDNVLAFVANGLLMTIFLGAMVIKLHTDISEADSALAARVLGGLGDTFNISLVMGIFSIAFAVVMVLVMVLRILSRMRQTRKRELMDMMARLDKTVSQARQCRFPATVISFEAFAKLGGLQPHEMVRDAGHLQMFDTFENFLSFCTTNPVVFISHQWLHFSQPDPNRIHYRAILEACTMLMRDQRILPERLHIWIECVPALADCPNLDAIACAISMHLRLLSHLPPPFARISTVPL